MGKKYLLQRRSVEVTEASLVEVAEVEQLGQALVEWLRTGEGPVATSGLELCIAECRLLHAISK